jgi:uncharacterized protein YfaP (DUF2135 family)
MATRKSSSKATTRARRIVRGLSKVGRTAFDRAKPELRKAYGRAKVATAQAGELIREEIHHLSAPKSGARSSKLKSATNRRRSAKPRSTVAAKATRAKRAAVRTVRKVARKGARRAHLA